MTTEQQAIFKDVRKQMRLKNECSLLYNGVEFLIIKQTFEVEITDISIDNGFFYELYIKSFYPTKRLMHNSNLKECLRYIFERKTKCY